MKLDILFELVKFTCCLAPADISFSQPVRMCTSGKRMVATCFSGSYRLKPWRKVNDSNNSLDFLMVFFANKLQCLLPIFQSI